jgi:hypothetical protein
MSEYCDIKTEFKSEPALIAALQETGGWTADQIERHATPQSLTDFHGNVRPDAAHVIIRRKHVGPASNDLGFVRQADGRYQMIISDFDRGNGEYANMKHARYGEAWQARLRQNYAYHAIRLQQQARGRTVTRQTVGGKVIVTVGGYRR